MADEQESHTTEPAPPAFRQQADGTWVLNYPPRPVPRPIFPDRRGPVRAAWFLLGALVGAVATGGWQKMREIQDAPVLSASGGGFTPGDDAVRDGDDYVVQYRHGRENRLMFTLSNDGDRPVQVRSIETGFGPGRSGGASKVSVHEVDMKTQRCIGCFDAAEPFRPFTLAPGAYAEVWVIERFHGCGWFPKAVGRDGVSGASVEYRRFGKTQERFLLGVHGVRAAATSG